jgi:hypothetical protein
VPEEGTKTYWVNFIGTVTLVFSQRHRGEKLLPLVIDAFGLSRKDIFERYYLGWLIEGFFKSGK